MANLQFDESLVSFIDAATPTDVERQLADKLHAGGFVRDTFADALVGREKEYPTALKVGKHNVAIPHTEAEHTIKGAVAVGILKHPVTWHRMDDADETCDVEFVVMLAVNDPHDHLELLQKVIALVQNQELIGHILNTASAKKVVDLVGPRLA